MLKSSRYDTILVIGAEIFSRIVDWEERSTCVLFGDAAGAAVIQVSEEPGILASYCGADGAYADAELLGIPAGGSRMPANAVTVASWGGAYTESQQKAYADTWSDPSSVKFENYNGGLGEVRAQVESGSVTWDIVDVLPSDAITGCDE